MAFYPLPCSAVALFPYLRQSTKYAWSLGFSQQAKRRRRATASPTPDASNPRPGVCVVALAATYTPAVVRLRRCACSNLHACGRASASLRLQQPTRLRPGVCVVALAATPALAVARLRRFACGERSRDQALPVDGCRYCKSETAEHGNSQKVLLDRFWGMA